MMLSSEHIILLALVRIGLGHADSDTKPEIIDWELIKEMASLQGLTGIVWDAALKLYQQGALVDGRTIDVPLKKKWIAYVINYEQKYSNYRKTIGEMASFYHQHGFKMMVLKGYGLSLNYPVPEHRPCGDIDIWLFGKYKEADETLTKEKGISVDDSHFHHTTFYWGDFFVENHYDLVNVLVSRSNARIEKLFKEMAMDDSNSVEIDGETVYLPSPDFHTLFLLRHAILHFTGEGMILRQLLDWGLFIEKNNERINWPVVYDVIKQYGMSPFFDCLNAICIEDLGFDSKAFPSFQIDPIIKNRVLESILVPEEKHTMPSNLIKRLFYKYRRRRNRKWKHDLCYKESQMDHLLTSVWLHLRHPETI